MTTKLPTLNQGRRADRGVNNDGWRGVIMNSWQSGCVFKGVLMQKQYSGKP
jgi:hypothetical protein